MAQQRPGREIEGTNPLVAVAHGGETPLPIQCDLLWVGPSTTILDMTRGGQTVEMEVDGFLGQARYVAAFAPDGVTVAIPGADGDLVVFDANTGAPLVRHATGTAPVSHDVRTTSNRTPWIEFSADGAWVARTSNRFRFESWSVPDGRRPPAELASQLTSRGAWKLVDGRLRRNLDRVR